MHTAHRGSDNNQRGIRRREREEEKCQRRLRPPPPIRNRRFFSAGRLSLITPCCKSLMHVVNRVREGKISVSYFSPKRACLWAGSHLEKVGRKEKFVSYRPPIPPSHKRQVVVPLQARWGHNARLLHTQYGVYQMMPSWTSLLAQLEMASPALCAVSVPTTGMLVAEQLVTRPEGLPHMPAWHIRA